MTTPDRGHRPPRAGARPTAADLTGALSEWAALVCAADRVRGVVDWAEAEIAGAARRHPAHADVLYHAFPLLVPRDLGAGMGTEFVYRAHATELLRRLVNQDDTRPATAAEICVGCAEVSLRIPMHGPAAGLYLRMWQQAFAHLTVTGDGTERSAGYEQLYGAQIDELEQLMRHALADPNRHLGDVDCDGRHHGRLAACRYTRRGRRG